MQVLCCGVNVTVCWPWELSEALRSKVIFRVWVGFQVGTEIALETQAPHELATERPHSCIWAKLSAREHDIKREECGRRPSRQVFSGLQFNALVWINVLSENINSKQFIAKFLRHMIVYPFTLTVGLK